MNVIEIIDKKRQGFSHTQEELEYLINGVMEEKIPDYQLSAWLMAVCCKGLNLDETTWLTDFYVKSGKSLDFSNTEGIIADKHSTGGVGDKTTLVVAPLLASCGIKVAKLSGRGLGFTGGTVDKLEAIPGFKVDLSVEQFISQIKSIGIALGSQTQELAPADGKIYALRDVTATVASIPLIAASVVSKKIAAGAQVIVLDIKVGEGAFMKSLEDAKALAFTCREVGNRLERTISTAISCMEQPLGNAIGHTLEVIEAIETLKGNGPEDLTQISVILGSMALIDAGIASNMEKAQEILKDALYSGKALQTFSDLIASQHGDIRIIDDYSLMPQPKQKITILSPEEGWVKACHALKLAQAAKVLGAGRLTKGAPVDLGVGIKVNKKIGDYVSQGEPIAELLVNTTGVDEARKLVIEAYQFSKTAVNKPVLIEELNFATKPTIKI